MFFHAGIIPEDVELLKLAYVFPPLPQPRIAPPSAPPAFLPAAGEWWIGRYRVAFTDGTDTDPDDSRLGRGAWAIFVACNSPLNLSGIFHGDDQSAYRAELVALVICCETSVVPNMIYVDNQSVQSAAFNYATSGGRIASEYCRDLWHRFMHAVDGKPEGYFCILWTKGHLDKFPELIAAGLFDTEHMQRNMKADELAASAVCPIGIHYRTKARTRQRLALRVHTFLLEVWERRLSEWKAEHPDVSCIDDGDGDDEPLLSDEGEVDDETIIVAPICLNVVNKFQAVKTMYPFYDWNKPYGPGMRGSSPCNLLTRWKGKPIEATFAFPISLWKPWIDYLARLVWWSNDEGSSPVEITFAEIVIDFELYAGISIGDNGLTWAKKARILSTMWRTTCKLARGWIGTDIVRARVSSLVPLGMQLRQPGLKHFRPRFLNERADSIVALNVQAIVQSRLAHTRSNSCEGALAYEWKRFGAIIKPHWKPRENITLHRELHSTAYPRRRIRRKTPFARMPLIMAEEPDNGAGVLRFLFMD